jgi:acetyltransferase-like isoleucine patch superfamily enzyme
MNRDEHLQSSQNLGLYQQIKQLHDELDTALIDSWQRSLPLNEVFIDRWERAQKLGFGSESSIYDSALVFGNPQIGAHCWIGPFTIIDGSGGLTVGDHCTLSAGVQIYTHDNVQQTLSSGQKPIERKPVVIGHNVYVAPNALITKGVTIGTHCVIGAGALINRDIPDYSIVFGQPGKVVGKVEISENNDIKFIYFSQSKSSST